MGSEAKRVDDPEHFDPTPFRAGDSTLRIGYKEASLSVRGVGVFLALGVLAIMASIFFSGWQTQQAISGLRDDATKEHRILRTASDRSACILTMSIEDRAQFRQRYIPGAFKQMCAWMEE
jgi:hypothetical protein